MENRNDVYFNKEILVSTVVSGGAIVHVQFDECLHFVIAQTQLSIAREVSSSRVASRPLLILLGSSKNTLDAFY